MCSRDIHWAYCLTASPQYQHRVDEKMMVGLRACIIRWIMCNSIEKSTITGKCPIDLYINNIVQELSDITEQIGFYVNIATDIARMIALYTIDYENPEIDLNSPNEEKVMHIISCYHRLLPIEYRNTKHREEYDLMLMCHNAISGKLRSEQWVKENPRLILDEGGQELLGKYIYYMTIVAMPLPNGDAKTFMLDMDRFVKQLSGQELPQTNHRDRIAGILNTLNNKHYLQNFLSILLQQKRVMIIPPGRYELDRYNAHRTLPRQYKFASMPRFGYC